MRLALLLTICIWFDGSTATVNDWKSRWNSVRDYIMRALLRYICHRLQHALNFKISISDQLVCVIFCWLVYSDITLAAIEDVGHFKEIGMDLTSSLLLSTWKSSKYSLNNENLDSCFPLFVRKWHEFFFIRVVDSWNIHQLITKIDFYNKQ